MQNILMLMAVKMMEKKMHKKIKLPTNGLSIRAGFQPSSFNEENRTIEVVFSTGSKGKRGFFTEYFEELSMKKSDVRLERLNAGAPVLNNHSRSKGLEGIIGVVEKAWIQNGQGIATIRFSEREEVQGIVKDIKSGVIRNVSVGYTVHTYKDVSKKGDDIPTYRAVDWEPMEISFVDIPFDKDSQSRSTENNDTYECTLEQTEENLMDEKIKEACRKAGLNEEVAISLIERGITEDQLEGEMKRAVATKLKENEEATETKEEITPVAEEVKEEVRAQEVKVNEVELERSRVLEITNVARSLGLDSSLIDENIKNGTSLEDFRKIAIEVKAKTDQNKRTNNQNVEVSDMDNKQLMKRGVENALLNKFDGRKYELSKEGSDFRFSRLTDLAKRVLEIEGVNTSGMPDAVIAERALHSTSDFKEILANVANKSLRDAYDMAAPTWMPIVREVEVPDFKEISRTQLHSGAGLSEVKENGEYEHTTMSESAEKYSIKEYGKIIGITRKTLINDDLNSFTRVPQQMGLKARSLESKLIWAIIQSNPLMADGFALFSTQHGNLAAVGSVIDVASVNAGFAAMEAQTDLDGELIDISPSYLVGPSLMRSTIGSFLGATNPNKDADVNVFKDLDGIIERRLTGNAWYLMASAMMIDMIEIARLAGQTGPQISQQEGFEVSGLKLKVNYDFGAKVIDHRGFYKNPGV